MEEIIASLFEKSIVYGAFLWLLWHILGEFNSALKENSRTMKEMSKTLVSLDKRLAKIEHDKGEDENAS